ncbi:hypothetical protein AVEN_187333-1 [Araneus ventricosus]|uniref:Uncharacterized protein n=1 Tax=Araneus ventricosus TaxID=182803 RepID=A0A4Y2HZK4_ARAVE|nr:hypothetical protein AVEN_187333-1 [Araneus ventricosus]
MDDRSGTVGLYEDGGRLHRTGQGFTFLLEDSEKYTIAMDYPLTTGKSIDRTPHLPDFHSRIFFLRGHLVNTMYRQNLTKHKEIMSRECAFFAVLHRWPGGQVSTSWLSTRGLQSRNPILPKIRFVCGPGTHQIWR